MLRLGSISCNFPKGAALPALSSLGRVVCGRGCRSPIYTNDLDVFRERSADMESTDSSKLDPNLYQYIEAWIWRVQQNIDNIGSPCGMLQGGVIVLHHSGSLPHPHKIKWCPFCIYVKNVIKISWWCLWGWYQHDFLLECPFFQGNCRR